MKKLFKRRSQKSRKSKKSQRLKNLKLLRNLSRRRKHQSQRTLRKRLRLPLMMISNLMRLKLQQETLQLLSPRRLEAGEVEAEAVALDQIEAIGAKEALAEREVLSGAKEVKGEIGVIEETEEVEARTGEEEMARIKRVSLP